MFSRQSSSLNSESGRVLLFLCGNIVLFGILFHFIGAPLFKSFCGSSMSSFGVMCRTYIPY